MRTIIGIRTGRSSGLGSSYWTPSLKWKIDTVVGGKYVDSSGNRQNADAVTITTENDGIKIPNHATIKEYCYLTGVYDLFYDSTGSPKSVLKSQIGHIYNNQFFCNDTYIELYSEPLTGTTLTDKTTELFGAIDDNAATIIAALGVTSELDKRLVDTHVKELKAINSIQANFFVYNDLANSILKALYPMMGSTLNQVRTNWIKATDADASYRAALISGTATKIGVNMVNFDKSFALTTYFNPSTKLASPNSFSYYSLFDLPSGGVQTGETGWTVTSGGYKGIVMAIRRDGSGLITDTYQTPDISFALAETKSDYFYLTNKVSNTDCRRYRQGTQIGDPINPGVSAYPNQNIPIGAYGYATSIATAYRTNLPCGYYHIGAGIALDAVKPFNDAVIRLVSAKNYCYFPPDETAAA